MIRWVRVYVYSVCLNEYYYVLRGTPNNQSLWAAKQMLE